MARSDYYFSRRAGGGGFVRRKTREGVDYSKFATKEWALLISFFRWYPDILEQICIGDNAKYSNSLMNSVTKRYMARYQQTFTFATRGYGKTTCVVSDKCNKGILWPGEITGYYAPVEKQAAPLASKAFADYSQNTPLLANHWDKDNDAREHFKISTPNGSKFIMDIDRGVDTSGVVAEEAAQEDKNPFNFAEFNQIVLGTNRLQHYVNGAPDPTHIDSQIHYITSISRKENEAFVTYTEIRRDMMRGESAFALCIPWQVPVLCRMKPFSYYNMLRKKLTAEQFMRECETHSTGTIENPIVKDSVLQASRTVMCMEDRHCGDPDVIYILGYDVSSRDIAGNALTAMSVIKCEKNSDSSQWDHFKKSLVYVMDTRPPSEAADHARLIKKRWNDYRINNGKVTYIVIDARSYGKAVVECLHKDLGDGLPPLSTITHEQPYNLLEQPGAIPCIYPLQATGNVGRDPNSEMLDYIEREYESKNLCMLTANIVDGTKAYKLKHRITDDYDDVKIQFPYLKTKQLCQQINNLKKKYTSSGWIEAAISQGIQKDMWSATLYACRQAQRLEKDELYEGEHRESEWEKEAFAPMAATNEYTVRPRAVKRLGRMAIK